MASPAPGGRGPRADRVRFEAFYLSLPGSPRFRVRAVEWALDLLGPGARAVSAGTGADSPGTLIFVPRAPTPGAAWSRSRALTQELQHRLGTECLVEPLFGVTAAQPAPTRTVAAKARPLPCSRDNEWSLEAARAQRAWTLTPPHAGRRMGEGVLVAHPDTGYTAHPELIGTAQSPSRVRAELGFDFVAERTDPRDPLRGSNAHGTATGSVIVSDAGGGDPFVSGIAPAAQLVPLRVSDEVVHFSFTRVVRALHHALDVAGAHVISMSLGGPFPSRALEDAVRRAVGRGTIVLAAAGNVWPWVVYPARLDDVIAVAATNCRDLPWKHGASGRAVTIGAPGESVWRAYTERRGKRLRFSVAPSSGTSYAVAAVAGAAALWLAFHGQRRLTAAAGGPAGLQDLFAHLLARTARVPTGWHTQHHGAGILDCLRLLEADPAHIASAPRRAQPKRSLTDDPLDRIDEFFAPSERARVRARLASRLGRTPARRRRALAALAAELIFHVATDAPLRRALARPPGSTRKSGRALRTGGGVGADVGALPVAAPKRASRELRALWNSG